jgi:hypothetical protein
MLACRRMSSKDIHDDQTVATARTSYLSQCVKTGQRSRCNLNAQEHCSITCKTTSYIYWTPQRYQYRSLSDSLSFSSHLSLSCEQEQHVLRNLTQTSSSAQQPRWRPPAISGGLHPSRYVPFHQQPNSSNGTTRVANVAQSFAVIGTAVNFGTTTSVPPSS